MPQPPKPTEAELSILQILWRLGQPATVKEVHIHESRTRDLGYTAVLKLMQTMHGKGLLIRDDSERAHRYWPVLAKARTQDLLLGDFMNKVFSGSAGEMVQMALHGRKLTDRERSELQALLGEKSR